MVILLNEKACAGKAIEKWKLIENEIHNQFGSYNIIQCNENSMAQLKDRLNGGCRQFAVAGGDGTVNYLLNTLVKIAGQIELSEIKIGAIGLGSSNDFHKPFQYSTKIKGIPYRLNFENSLPYDLGILNWKNQQGINATSYWINNASVGITADANYLFNHPNSLLNSLKANNTNSAILYSALKTIVSYKNIFAGISFNDCKPVLTEITNLGIVKNPSFSGSFCYDTPYLRNNGDFYVHSYKGKNICETLRVLYGLSRKKFSGIKGTQSIKANVINISSEEPFSVEYDGETVKTNYAEFSLMNNGVRLCS